MEDLRRPKGNFYAEFVQREIEKFYLSFEFIFRSNTRFGILKKSAIREKNQRWEAYDFS